MLKYETDKLKTKSTASFAKSTDTGAKHTITDAKLTVMNCIYHRWRANRYQEKSNYGENVTCRKHTLGIQGKF